MSEIDVGKLKLALIRAARVQDDPELGKLLAGGLSRAAITLMLQIGKGYALFERTDTRGLYRIPAKKHQPALKELYSAQIIECTEWEFVFRFLEMHAADLQPAFGTRKWYRANPPIEGDALMRLDRAACKLTDYGSEAVSLIGEVVAKELRKPDSDAVGSP